MLIKKEGPLIERESYSFKDNDNSDEEGELKIDLDYDEYVNTKIEEDDIPLDLSLNQVSNKQLDKIDSSNIPKIEVNSNHIFSKIVEQPVLEVNNKVEVNFKGCKNSTLTEEDLEKLLDPFMKYAEKKFTCTVCDIKFNNKAKAIAHLENKHIDCLQYKCPLCRGSKSSRLAYESHIRRGHGANVKSYHPIIRCKKKFFVKSKTQNETLSNDIGKPYDLTFVTFLRHLLSLGEEAGGNTSSWHQTVACAEWVEKDQGVFRVNNKQELITRWCSFKVLFAFSFTFESLILGSGVHILGLLL